MPTDFLEEYRRKEFQKHLKTIVSEVNALLKTDYNLITFDLLQSIALRQVLLEVLGKFKLISKAEISNASEKLCIMNIFNALSNIRYDPDNMYPNEFREGVIKSERKVIYPILYWILTNKTIVEKRAYLSRFVKKIDVPINMIPDADFQGLIKEYDAVIEEFWASYRENKKRKIVAVESEELESDIALMKKDIVNLTFRLEKQKDKIKNMPNKEQFLELAKTNQEEIAHGKKLSEQVKEANELMGKLEDSRKEIRQNLEKQKMGRILKVNPCDQLQKDLSLNKLIFMNQLPRDVVFLKNDLDICELVANGEVPRQSELRTFEEKIEKLVKDVNKLGINRSCANAEANLDLFRKHVEILANKKKEITDNVCQLKQNLVDVDLLISEYVQKQHDVVGGEVLHGEKLKNFVSSLREQSVTYKKLKPQLNAVNEELSIARRTLDILMLIDPNLRENLLNRDALYKEAQKMDDIEEIKIKIRATIKEIEFKKIAFAQKRNEFIELETLVSSMSRIYFEDKDVYDNATGELVNEIEELKVEIESSKAKVNEKTELKQKLNREIKNKEELYVRLSEEYINSIGEGDSDFPTMKEALEERIKALEDVKLSNLEEKIKMENLQRENEEQLKIYNKVYNIFSVGKRV